MVRKFLVGLAFSLIMLMVIYMGFGVGMMSGGNAAKKKPESTKLVETKREEIKLVKVQKVELQDLPLSIKGEGRVNSLKNIKVTSEVQGKVIGGINLKMGQSFKKGQLLYQLDSKEYSLSLKARKSNFITLLAGTLADVKQDFPQQYSTWRGFYTNVSPEEQLPALPKSQTSKEKTFIATKGISAEYYTIKSMEEKLRKYNYYAPFTGSVLTSYTDVGAIVNPGSPVIDIIQNGNLEVEIPMSIEASKVVRTGSVVTLTDKETRKENKGRVQRKGSFVNASTQSIPVYIKITSGQDLYNGMYLSAVFPAGEVKDVITFPKRALVDGNFVYEVKDSLLFKKQIDLVHQEDNKVYIKGVENNSIIVSEPLLNVKDSMRVSPMYNTKNN
jgi:RND family efflux transporter MFP subunit